MSQTYKTLSELFADRKRWIQHDGAVDETGRDVASNDPKACAWCLLFGIYHCYGIDATRVMAEVDKSIAKLFADRVAPELVSESPKARIVEFNDSVTFEEVQRVVTLTEDVIRIYGIQ